MAHRIGREFTIALLFVAFASPVPRPVAAASIHEIELRDWRAREAAGWQPWRDPRGLPIIPRASRERELAREVHGFYPYWMGSDYEDYDWSLISTVAFFSLEVGANGDVAEDHGWPWTGLVNAAHAGGARVIVTATNFSSSPLTTLLASPANRTNAVSGLVAAVVIGGADGVNVDFENLPAAVKNEFVLFVEELRAALDAALADPYLSVATPAVDWAASYRYQLLSERCDHLMIMAYDYHWSGAPTTGPVAPLTGWGAHNVAWTVDNYRSWGAPPDKMLLGVAYYGYDWPAAGPDPGAATTGGGTARTYASAQPEGLAQGLLWDMEGQSPWYRRFTDRWRQVWFDDAESLGFKYDYVLAEQLGGIGIWALGYDGSLPGLRNALDEAFSGGDDLPDDPPPAAPLLVLRRPWPNPAAGEVHVPFTLSRASTYRIDVFDVRGRAVAEIDAGLRLEGEAEVVWGTGSLPNGLYLIRFHTPEETAQRKLLLLR